MKRYIVCNAMKKSDIGDELESHTIPCMEAITQLWLFPNAKEYHNHWAKEVWNQFHRVPVIKKSHKYPTANFIIENTWFVNESQVDYCIEWAIQKEATLDYDKKHSKDINSLYNIMELYFIWMSETLSKSGRILPNECYSKLKELGLLN